MKVLLVDSNRDRADPIADRLMESTASEVLQLGPAESLTQAVQRLKPEVIIVDMARPDRDGLDGIREVAAKTPMPIVLFVDQDDRSFMEAAVDAGVSSYNVVGAALPDVKLILQVAVAMFTRYQQLETDLRKAEASLAERSVIDRAKAKLMRERRMAEPEAYHWLRRRAMDRGRRLAEIAAELLDPPPRSDGKTS